MKHSVTFWLLLAAHFMMACNNIATPLKQELTPGIWRGVIHLQEQELPFHFRLSGTAPDSLFLTLLNGEEELAAGQVTVKGDSLVMPMHIFDTQINAVIQEDGSLKGVWQKNYADNYQLPFMAVFEDPQKKGKRFNTSDTPPATSLSGRWAVNFLGEDTTTTQPNAVGIFEQRGNSLTGTFLTPTGDYRYLEGSVAGDEFSLSAFDGEHAFLFKGNVRSTDRLEGTFWSGKTWEEKWVATRNENASLPHADSLTFLKPGYDQLSFSFPNLEGELVSLTDSAYRNKVVIVQLFGSWCPNCMDETKFLADWYRRNQSKEVAIIGLAYEKKDDFEYARQRVLKMADKLNVGYDFLIAGTSDKQQAAETLPMLNHVLAFPTTIFLDKSGTIRRIHTGFSGPGTGAAYEAYVEDFNLFVDKLLREPAPAESLEN